jgi:hypothetical protein
MAPMPFTCGLYDDSEKKATEKTRANPPDRYNCLGAAADRQDRPTNCCRRYTSNAMHKRRSSSSPRRVVETARGGSIVTLSLAPS